MMCRKEFIAKVMDITLSLGRASKSSDINERVIHLEEDIVIMDSIDRVTPEEFYNKRYRDSKTKFDKLPLHKRNYFILEVLAYLKAKELYKDSFQMRRYTFSERDVKINPCDNSVGHGGNTNGGNTNGGNTNGGNTNGTIPARI